MAKKDELTSKRMNAGTELVEESQEQLQEQGQPSTPAPPVIEEEERKPRKHAIVTGHVFQHNLPEKVSGTLAIMSLRDLESNSLSIVTGEFLPKGKDAEPEIVVVTANRKLFPLLDVDEPELMRGLCVTVTIEKTLAGITTYMAQEESEPEAIIKVHNSSGNVLAQCERIPVADFARAAKNDDFRKYWYDLHTSATKRMQL